MSTFVLFLLLVWLLFELYRLLLDKIRPAVVNEWLALFGAAWFGRHPAMAETVNYVIQRGDLYCTLGCVAGLYILHAIRGRGGRGFIFCRLRWRCCRSRLRPCFRCCWCCTAISLRGWNSCRCGVCVRR